MILKIVCIIIAVSVFTMLYFSYNDFEGKSEKWRDIVFYCSAIIGVISLMSLNFFI